MRDKYAKLSGELTKGIHCEYVHARENWIFPRADARISSPRTRMSGGAGGGDKRGNEREGE